MKRHFPHATHERVRSRRAAVVGQGELKRGGHDPIFPFNHTAACFRGNVGRLARKTWTTSKKASCLEAHMWLAAEFHNQYIEWKERMKEARASRRARKSARS